MKKFILWAFGVIPFTFSMLTLVAIAWMSDAVIGATLTAALGGLAIFTALEWDNLFPGGRHDTENEKW